MTDRDNTANNRLVAPERLTIQMNRPKLIEDYLHIRKQLEDEHGFTLTSAQLLEKIFSFYRREHDE